MASELFEAGHMVVSSTEVDDWLFVLHTGGTYMEIKLKLKWALARQLQLQQV